MLLSLVLFFCCNRLVDIESRLKTPSYLLFTFLADTVKSNSSNTITQITNNVLFPIFIGCLQST